MISKRTKAPILQCSERVETFVLLGYLLLLQRDDRAVAPAASLSLEGSNLLRLDPQDLLLLLVLYLQLLKTDRKRKGQRSIRKETNNQKK